MSRGGQRLLTFADLPDRKIAVCDVDAGIELASLPLTALSAHERAEVGAVAFDPSDHNRFCLVQRRKVTTCHLRTKFGQYAIECS